MADEAWIGLIAEAQWAPKRKRVGRGLMTLERGQLAHAERFMAERWKWARGWWWWCSARGLLLPETQPTAEKVWSIMGYGDLKNLPPGWCGLPNWLDAGIRGGGCPS